MLTDSYVENHPENAKAFAEAYKQAGKNLTADKAKEIAKKYLNQEDDVLDISLQWISYDDLEITEETYNVLLEKVKAYGLSDDPPSYEDFVLTNFN